MRRPLGHPRESQAGASTPGSGAKRARPATGAPRPTATGRASATSPAAREPPLGHRFPAGLGLRGAPPARPRGAGQVPPPPPRPPLPRPRATRRNQPLGEARQRREGPRSRAPRFPALHSNREGRPTARARPSPAASAAASSASALSGAHAR